MLRVVLIDDERLALIQLESTLRALGSTIVTATYTNPQLAMSEAAGWEADIIFLDIDMPGLNGMEAAKQLEESCPGSAIVFVSAHNSFALEAFEVSAQDYLLKPVSRERLSRTLQRIRSRKINQLHTDKPDSLLIRCFNAIQFERGGVPIRDFRWRTSKAQELFAFLLYHHDRIVVKDKLVELLWPEASFKRASTHLYTAIYQIRQSLKRADIGLVISNASVGEGYMLESGDAQIDAVLWEEGVVSLDPVDDYNAAEHEELLKLYTGDYLGIMIICGPRASASGCATSPCSTPPSWATIIPLRIISPRPSAPISGLSRCIPTMNQAIWRSWTSTTGWAS